MHHFYRSLHHLLLLLSFASFFTEKINKLRLSLTAVSSVLCSHSPSPPATSPQFSTSRATTKSEISKILFNCHLILILFLLGFLKMCFSSCSYYNQYSQPAVSSALVSSILFLKNQFLLKKCSLDKDQLSNYCPINSFPYPKLLNVLSNLDLLISYRPIPVIF